MVCKGLKAQVLARMGMDIRGGNHPSNRRAFSPVLTRVANTRPVPDGAGCGHPHPNCGPLHDAGCSRPSSGCGSLEAGLLVRTAGNSGWSTDTSAPGSPLTSCVQFCADSLRQILNDKLIRPKVWHLKTHPETAHALRRRPTKNSLSLPCPHPVHPCPSVDSG